MRQNLFSGSDKRSPRKLEKEGETIGGGTGSKGGEIEFCGRNFSAQAAGGDLLAAERKLGSARSGVEEIRGALEAADRARRMQEQELLECR